MHMVFGFLTLGPGEIAIIAVIALILFGPEKLPEIGKQIGMAYRELNRLRGDVQRALDIDEYTRLELPDYSAPSGSTYPYHTSTETDIPDDSHYHSEYHDSFHPQENNQLILAEPPGPPSRFAQSKRNLNATEDVSEDSTSGSEAETIVAESNGETVRTEHNRGVTVPVVENIAVVSAQSV